MDPYRPAQLQNQRDDTYNELGIFLVGYTGWNDGEAQVFARLLCRRGRRDDRDDQLSRLAAARDVELAGQVAIEDAVRASRLAGASWLDVGRAIGITKQAAQQRFCALAPGGANES